MDNPTRHVMSLPTASKIAGRRPSTPTTPWSINPELNDDMPESDPLSVVPAQLSFLAIYNPLLGTTDETLHDQVVFYTSRSSLERRLENAASTEEDKDAKDIANERLRQIGLAQGMVSFARNFSAGKPVDYVETEKSQIVIHELEKDWWILASIDLTRLPAEPNNGSSSQRNFSETPFHYSSREITPPQLQIQQLLRAHSIFLLHHASSLDTLYQGVDRSTFCLFLENFWLRFAWNWEILLSGNPAVEMYNGIKLSAGGELGIGVGEEEWGSGEREVLEDFVSRTDGLLDLVVSRFGDAHVSAEKSQMTSKLKDHAENQWLGLDIYPRPSDGVVFSGVEAISRQSLVSISQWMEWIYRYGADTYGVGEDPSSPRRRRRRKRRRNTLPGKATSNQPAPPEGLQGSIPDRSFSPGIPRPLIRGTPSPKRSSKDQEEKAKSQAGDESSHGSNDKASDWMATGTETFVKYLTLGYGSSWSLSGTSSPRPQTEILKQDGSNELSPSAQDASKRISGANDQPRYRDSGRFIIGLQDRTASPDIVLEEIEPTLQTATPNERIAERTIHVHMKDSDFQQNSTDSVQLRAIVYIHQPFIYTFLFDKTTPTLSEPSLYHGIHHQLGPLQKLLSTSTSPEIASSRMSITVGRSTSIPGQQQIQSQQIYDLIYDPQNLTIRSSIPNIPDLISHRLTLAEPAFSALPRVESISIHHRVLTTYIETRSRPLELERTCKTSRGWWIVWVRVSPSLTQNKDNPDFVDNPPRQDTGPRQEAFVLRRASDHPFSSSSTPGHARNTSSIGAIGGSIGGNSARFFRDLGGASASPGLSRIDLGPARLVEGLGIDARRYIEGLLSLNR
ncbi:hypothetical protein BJX99DRAFT_209073 [Aspergillus californicus]